jgi:hypothetical protein
MGKGKGDSDTAGTIFPETLQGKADAIVRKPIRYFRGYLAGHETMIWVSLLPAQLLFGFQAVLYLLKDKFDITTLLACSIPIGFSLSSILFFLVSALLGINILHLFIHTAGLFVVSLFLLVYNHKLLRSIAKQPPRSDWLFFGASLVLSLLIVPRMYPAAPFCLHKSFVPDIAEEFGLIQSFYRGVNGGFVNLFKIRHPSCYKCHCRSRWLTAFHSSLFLIGFASLRKSFVIPSLFMFFSICFLLLKLAQRHLRHSVFAIGSLLLFLFGGGYGFFDWFEPEGRASKDFDFVYNSGLSLTEWSHPLFHYIFAHRPSQLSLALVIGIFLALAKSVGKREMAFVGVILGILPAVQHQVFMGAIAWLVVFFGVRFLKGRRDPPVCFAVFGAFFGIVGAVPLLHYLPRSNHLPLVIRERFWHSVSHSGGSFPWLTVWWQSLGLFGLLSLTVAWFFIDRRLTKLYIPSAALFVLANAYKFQGYSRQNIIVFYPFWVVMAVVVFFAAVEALCRRAAGDEVQGVVIGIALVVFVTSVASGVLGYIQLRNARQEVWDEDGAHVADWVVRNTPRKAVFIATTGHFDAVSQLAGKVQYIQSDRAVWMAGFDIVGRTLECEMLLRGSDLLTLAPKVGWVVSGPPKAGGRRLEQTWKGNWSRVFSSGDYIVYQRHM